MTDASNETNVAKEANVINKLIATKETIDTAEADEFSVINKARELCEMAVADNVI